MPKKIIKNKFIIINILTVLLALIIFSSIKSLAEYNIATNEEKLVRMVASLSRAKDSNNVINTTILESELDTYAGDGKTTITDGTDVITVTFTETGNEYEIYKNQSYTITYDLNGGTGTTPGTQTKGYGHRITVPTSEATKEDYTFAGWSEDNTATTPTYKPGGHYLNNSNATLYAVWKANAEYLLNNGEVQTLAGGFTHYAQQYNSELTYPTGYMQLKNTNSGSMSLVRSNNQIDWGNYSKLYIQVGETTIRSDISTSFCFALDINGTSSTGRYLSNGQASTMSYFQRYSALTWEEDEILEFDISDVTTSGWFMFGICGNVGTWNIKNIWLEH